MKLDWVRTEACRTNKTLAVWSFSEFLMHAESSACNGKQTGITCRAVLSFGLIYESADELRERSCCSTAPVRPLLSLFSDLVEKIES